MPVLVEGGTPQTDVVDPDRSLTETSYDVDKLLGSIFGRDRDASGVAVRRRCSVRRNECRGLVESCSVVNNDFDPFAANLSFELI